jgi:hypothetical protein
MAVVAHTFTKFALSAATKLESLNGVDTIRVALFGPATSTNPSTLANTAQFYSDWTAISGGITEISSSAGGATYTAGVGNQPALTGVTVTSSSTTVTLSGTIPSLGSSVTSAFAPAWALFYDSAPGTAGTDPVIGFWDLSGAGGLGTTVPGGGGAYTLTVSGSGLLTFTNTNP